MTLGDGVSEGTVDNENMNKKKSKCCCIYEKPRMFGESSSEDEDDDCEHCHGHRKSDPKHQSPDSKSQDASQS
ncbi:E3 ubiquitin-protein ligase PPP1R11-like [Saccoglossus kowalevskii]